MDEVVLEGPDPAMLGRAVTRGMAHHASVSAVLAQRQTELRLAVETARARGAKWLASPALDGEPAEAVIREMVRVLTAVPRGREA